MLGIADADRKKLDHDRTGTLGRRSTAIAVSWILIAALVPASGSVPAGPGSLETGETLDSDLVGLEGNLDAMAALAALAEQDTPDVRDVFDVHVERVMSADPELAERVAPLLEQQRSNLDLVNQIQVIEGADHADDLARDFEVIAAATAWQATSLGVSLEIVEPHGHGSPSEAALALAERHGVDVHPDQHEKLLALDDLPEPQHGTLVALINAFLALEDATHAAYADADLDGLLEMMDGSDFDFDLEGGTLGDVDMLPETDHRAIVEAGVDVGVILGTRTQLLAAVMDFQREWEDFSFSHGGATGTSGPGIALCPALALDFQRMDTTYKNNCALVVDVGGNDTFLNNAGGSTTLEMAAALLNLDGNDQYISEGSRGVNGGGDLGVGFLYDARGSDTYTAGDIGTNGGGSSGGVGFLYDTGGSDTGTAGERGTNGGRDFVVVGFSHDDRGSDTDAAADNGMNARDLGEVGFPHDTGGSDTYTAGNTGTNGGGNVGVGFLYDARGDDTYSAGNIGTNGGSNNGGVGFLYDTGGDDTYTAGERGMNGGGNVGVGFLLDTRGIDRFEDDDHVCDNQDAEDCTLVPKGTVGVLIDLERHFEIEGDSGGVDRSPSWVNQTVGPVESPPTCGADPCEEPTPVFPGLDVTIPGVGPLDVGVPKVRIEETCVPILLCVGEGTLVPDTTIFTTPPVDGRNETLDSVVLDPFCDIAAEVCLGGIRLLDEEDLSVEVPAMGVHVAVEDITAFVDPLGPPTTVGPVPVTLPNPLGGDDIELVFCPAGCPVPATAGDSTLETEVTVTVWVGDEEHKETVPVVLET